jgi:hypothetical protein
MQLVNLTPHEIHDLNTDTVIPASGTVVRVGKCTAEVYRINNIPVYRTKFNGEIENLPDPKPNTVYIVSALYLNAIPEHRTDIVCPGNVKKIDGRVIGCYGFRTR